MNKAILGSVAALLAAFSFSVSAGNCPGKTGEMGGKSHHNRGMGMSAMVDTNKDGNISRDEAMSFHTQMFARLDLNGDGNVDTAEQANMRDAMREMRHSMNPQ